MGKTYLCPKCNSELERIAGCGSESYFCESCKRLISRSKMIEKVEDEDSNKDNDQ